MGIAVLFLSVVLNINNIILLILQVLLGAILYIGMSIFFKVDTFHFIKQFIFEKIKGRG